MLLVIFKQYNKKLTKRRALCRLTPTEHRGFAPIDLRSIGVLSPGGNEGLICWLYCPFSVWSVNWLMSKKEKNLYSL